MNKKSIVTLVVLGVGVIVLSTTVFTLIKKNNNNEEIKNEIVIENIVKEDIDIPYEIMFNTNENNISFNTIKNNDLNSVELNKSFDKKGGKLFKNDTNNIIFIENERIGLSSLTKEAINNNDIEDITNEEIEDEYSLKINAYELRNNNYIHNEYQISLDVFDDIIGASITNNEIVLITQEKIEDISYNNIYKIKKNNLEKEKITIKNLESEKGFVYNNNLYTFFGTHIRMTNLEDFESEMLNLGDDLRSYCIIDNQLYVYNNFGSGNNNSLLFQINLDTFRVTNLFETKDNRLFIKGIDLLNNKMYLQSKDVKIEDLITNSTTRSGFKIVEIDLINMKTIDIVDTIVEYEYLIKTKGLLFNNEFFIIK